MADYIWLFCLVVTHAVAYYLGRGDGKAMQKGPSDEAWVEVQKHEIDMKYALMSGIYERSRKHERTEGAV